MICECSVFDRIPPLPCADPEEAQGVRTPPTPEKSQKYRVS